MEYKFIYRKITDLSHLNKKLKLNKRIKSLINLQRLNLFDNQLKEIPKEIGSLINLKGLHLGDNQLNRNTKRNWLFN